MDKTTKGVKRASATSYQITFMYNGHKCRERVKCKPSVANDIKVNRFLHAIQQAIIDRTFNYIDSFPRSPIAKRFAKESEITLIENYLIDWFEIKKQTLKASTVKAYQNIINNFLIPNFGNLYLSELKRYHIKRTVNQWDVSKKLTNTRLSILRTALADAMDDEILDSNVLYGWTYHNKKAQPKVIDNINPFDADDLKSLLNGFPEAERNVFQFLFFTGLRPSEMRCLLWSDINIDNLTISVSKSQTDEAVNAETTKTKKSVRIVKILLPTSEALKSQKRLTYLSGQYVFLNPRTGTQWKERRLYKIWSAKLKQLKMKHRKMYQTRHTYASMMLSSGESVMWVSEQMGHSDWVMVGRVYAKWIPSTNPDAGNKGVDKFWRE